MNWQLFTLLELMRRFIKDIVLSILINAGILFALNYYQFGIIIEPVAKDSTTVFEAYVILWALFWIINYWLKSVIHFISTPLKWLSFWIVSILINVGILYFFQYFINSNYWDIARVTLSDDPIRVFIISIVVSFAYALLSKILK